MSAVRICRGGRRRLFIPVVVVSSRRVVGSDDAVRRLGGGRTPGGTTNARRSVRRHESGRRCRGGSAMAVVPRVLVHGTGVATAMVTQLAAGRHGRFQASGPLIRFGIVGRLAEILQTHTLPLDRFDPIILHLFIVPNPNRDD